jgi:hypothetical protein
VGGDAVVDPSETWSDWAKPTWQQARYYKQFDKEKNRVPIEFVLPVSLRDRFSRPVGLLS